MLQYLRIDHFALIDHVAIDFEEGMTVLTGETGAGKSMIIDAVALLAGGRGSVDFIRKGQESFHLRGLFYLPNPSEDLCAFLDQEGIEWSDHQLMIVRSLDRSGRNTIKVNDCSLTVSSLKKLGHFLIDIHSQNQSQALLNPAYHLSMLDEYAGQALAEALSQYREVFERFSAAKQALAHFNLNEQEIAQRLDLLSFQCKELSAAQLVVGEDEQLKEERDTLRNYQVIATSLHTALEALTRGEDNALDKVSQAQTSLDKIASLSSSFEEFSKEMTSIYFGLQELAYSVGERADDLSYDPDRLDHIENRLAVIEQLKHKYGKTIPEILAYYEKIEEEYHNLQDRDSHKEVLQADYQKAKADITQAARKLHEIRKAAADTLSQAIEEQLRLLYMPHTCFKAHFSAKKTFDRTGADQVEFLIQTNVGEGLKSLAKVASGGELSRVMLAAKATLQASRQTTTVIFDEVDTGVSGRVAQAIAQRLFKIALSAQVLCISHLPQVAAMADQQLHITKTSQEGRTQTQAAYLDAEDRIKAIASMTSGEDLTEAAHLAAKEQVAQSFSYRQERRKEQ